METKPEDELAFLQQLDLDVQPCFLEGGQTVSFWAEYFSAKEADVLLGAYQPFTSKEGLRRRSGFLHRRATLQLARGGMPQRHSHHRVSVSFTLSAPGSTPRPMLLIFVFRSE